jgi:hypothetical protein
MVECKLPLEEIKDFEIRSGILRRGYDPISEEYIEVFRNVVDKMLMKLWWIDERGTEKERERGKEGEGSKRIGKKN